MSSTCPFTEMASLAVDGDRVVFRGRLADRRRRRSSSSISRAARPDVAPAVDVDDVRPGRHRRCRSRSSSRRPAAGRRSGSSTRRTTGRSSGPDGALPPLIVTSHGGPTASAFGGLPGRRSSCSRAAASPSSTSTTAAAPATVATTASASRASGASSTSTTASTARAASSSEGLVDGERLAIRGGSASGYTTLCAVTFRDDVRGRDELLRDRRPRDVRRRRPTSSSRATSIGSSGRSRSARTCTASARRSTSPTRSRARC